MGCSFVIRATSLAAQSPLTISLVPMPTMRMIETERAGKWRWLENNTRDLLLLKTKPTGYATTAVRPA